MKWKTIKPVKEGRTHMTTHQLALGVLHVSVMERHPLYGFAYAFYPFIPTTKAKRQTLEDARQEALSAARNALQDTMDKLDEVAEVRIGC
jgi:hypothetical protein